MRRYFSFCFSAFFSIACLISTPLYVGAARADDAPKPSGIGRFLPWAGNLSNAIDEQFDPSALNSVTTDGKRADAPAPEASAEQPQENAPAPEASVPSGQNIVKEDKSIPEPPAPPAPPVFSKPGDSVPEPEPFTAPEPPAPPQVPEPAPAPSAAYIPGSVKFPTPSSFTNYSDSELADLYERAKSDEELDRINRDYIAQRLHKEGTSGTVEDVYAFVDNDSEMIELRVKMLEEEHKALAEIEQEKNSDQPTRRTVRNTKKLARGIIKLIIFLVGGGAATAGTIASRKKKKQ